MKKCVMMIAALCVFVINPMVMMSGCGMYDCSRPLKYDYSAADMTRELRAVPTVHRVSLEGERSVEVSFVLDPASLDQVARAQARRDFVLELVQSAYACSRDISRSIDVTGEVVVREISADGEPSIVYEAMNVAGNYTVNSTRLDTGRLVWGEGASYFNDEVAIAVIHTRSGNGEDADLIRVNLGEGSDLNYEHPEYVSYY